jgi:small subunit ribosomal protein S6
MRRYETIVIVDPDVPEENRQALVDRIGEIISARGGLLVYVDEWGSRKLAYELRKKNRGHYFRIDYCGDGPLVAEMERSFRIDERVLKFMTVLLNKDVDEAAVQAEMTAGEDMAEAEAETEAEAEANAEPEAEANAEPEAEANAEPEPESEPAGTPAEPESESPSASSSAGSTDDKEA